MKVLYVVNTCDNKYVNFQSVQIMEEKENEFIILDKMEIEEYVHNFPKSKINVEFNMGYVTDKLDKTLLRKQIDRIYEKLKNMYLNNGETQYAETNEAYYKSSIDLLRRCVTPEEYEKQGLAEKEQEQLERKFGFLW